MTKRASVSKAIKESAKCSLALLLGVLLLFATSSMLVPRSASADKGTPTWKQVGQLTTHTNLEKYVAEKDFGIAEPPVIVSSSFSQTTDSVRYAWFYGQDRYEKDGVALTETFDWNLPPKTIPVGHEFDIELSGSASITDVFAGIHADGSYSYAAPVLNTVEAYVGATCSLFELRDDVDTEDPQLLASLRVDEYEVESAAGEVEYPHADDIALAAYGGVMATVTYHSYYDADKPYIDKSNCFASGKFEPDFEDHSVQGLLSCTRTIADPDLASTTGFTVTPGATYLLVITIMTDNSTAVVTYYTYTVGDTNSAEPVNVEVESTPPKEGGEFGVWVIPALIIGGAAVIGGAVALSRRGRKGGDDDSGPGPGGGKPDDDPDNPPTFRMSLYKEFGDTLFVGGGPQTVGALIEQVEPDGGVYVRDDLTARISFGASTNLSAQDIGMQNHYRCVNVEALNADSPEAIVSITFAGEGGTFTNKVKFKVGQTELYFGDVALTFIAGYKQTLAIPFCFAGMQVPEGVEPAFECTLWTGNVGGQGSDYFTDVKVVRDREHPEAMWNVRLTETGAAPVLQPGELEHFTCEVTATWKTATGDSKISGIFDLYRFVEGIRLKVEPIKCYAVDREAKFVEFRGRRDDETPAEFRAKLDEWRAQLPEDSAKGEYVIPVECTGVVQQAARSVIRATLYTWGAGAVHDIGNPGWGQAFDEMPLLDPDDPDAADIVVRAVNPLPEFGKTKIEFADVPGSSVLKDADGNDVAHPCEAFGLSYFLKKIDYAQNEQTFHVVAAKGIMTPPNRVQVDVTVKMEWGGRKFERTERVMAISQPWRTDYAEKGAIYDAEDAHKRERLEYIQRRIIHSDTSTWKIEGGISLVETGAAIKDAFDDSSVRDAKEAVFKGAKGAIEEGFKETGEALRVSSEIAQSATGSTVSLTGAATGLNEAARLATRGVTAVAEKAIELNPAYQYIQDVETAGRVVVNVIGSINEQRKDRYMTYTEYGDMMPLYHYIQMMIDGYDPHYGFHEPDYLRVTSAFLKRARGETGPAQAVMEAYFSRELQYCDAVRMTVKDWNDSWVLVGLSIGCSVATAGMSDLFFIPMAAIGKGMEGAIDCIDKGGAKDYEIFRSACDAAARQLVFDVAMNKIAEEGMKWASFGKGVAESFTKEFGAEALFQKGVQGLTGFFSSSKAGQAVGSAAKVLAHELDEAKKAALAAMKAFEESAESLTGEVINRDIKYCLGRIEGKLKLENIEKVMKSGGKDLTRFERRQLLYAIQCDKHAMLALRADTSELGKAARKFYNAEIREVQEKAIHMAKVRLSETQKVPFKDIRVKGATGNVADDVVEGLTTPMDLDVTFQRYGGVDPKTGEEIWIDIVEKDGQPVLDQELFKIVHGYEGAADEVAKFGRAADHSVVSALGPESYGKWEDAMRVCQASRAGETLEDATTVGLTAERKCVHWQNMAKEAWADAAAARAAGDELAAELYEEAAEAFVEESGRQFTKQTNRIVENRLAVLKQHGVELPEGIQKFLNKAEAINMMGLEKVNGATAADVEGMLKTQFGSSLEETYHELNELTVLLNDMVARINGDFVAPGAVRFL